MKPRACSSEYVRIDTSNPPGDTRKAADFLAAIFEREGIPVTRYESAPGKAIIYARSEGDRVAAGGQRRSSCSITWTSCRPIAAQWKTRSVRRDRFEVTRLWGRGAFDMKGQGGRADPRVPAPEARSRAAYARRDSARRTRRGGRRRARRPLDDRQPLRRARPGVRDRRGRLSAAATCSRPASWSTASRSPRRRSSG